jgi:cellulose synthase/poly-beta-1,6-N-acetylglucosamine synthase-like glycosyltransferase
MIYLKIIFWISFIALAHTYIIYPVLLKLLAFSRSKIPSFTDPNETEKRKNEVNAVSILMAAYNEEKVIKEKLDSIFSSDYPKDKIEVIVGSDASTDRTNEIVRRFPGVQLVEFKERSGKVKIINHLKTLAKNGILLLTDANVMFDKETIRELTKHFIDPAIALVDSNMINTNLKGKGVSKAESTYIRGEAGLKQDEGKVFGMMIGPFGGCYAVRKNFYENVPENFLVDDFYINMKVLEKGGKAISEVNARVYEEVPTDWKVEFRRKIRIATGSFQNLFVFLPLLFKFNTLSFCFFSHKVLRWKGPFIMIVLYLINLFIILRITNFHELRMEKYLIIFALQNLLPILLIFDLILTSLHLHFPPIRLVTHFLTTNLAILIGFFRYLGGVRSSIWQPTGARQKSDSQ